MPKDSSHYQSDNLWTSHKFSCDEKADLPEALYQQHGEIGIKDLSSATPLVTPRPQANTKVQAPAHMERVMTRENLLQSIGFLKPDKFIKNISKVGKGNVSVSPLARNPKLDLGETASIKD